MQDYFTIELQTPTGQLLPSIEYDSHRWFVAEPGQEFVVQVSMVNYTEQDYRVSLKVDGNDPGYSLIYYGSNHTYKSCFQGWVQHAGAITGPGSSTYRLFKLGSCKPSQAAATVNSVEELSVGKIVVKIDKVVDTGRVQQRLNITAAAPSRDAADKKLPEGKKWFMAPGLKAEAGSVTTAATSWNTTIFQTVSTLPPIQVHYDSSEALYLRKALNPRFAPHRTILRQSANPAIAALGIDPVTNTGAPDEATSNVNLRGTAAGAAAAAGVKRETGVKRERGLDDDDDDDDDGFVPRSATAAHRIDLTEEPVIPMTVNGRQLAPDELAVCDLCDSDEDEAAPRWQVKKKQQVEVEP